MVTNSMSTPKSATLYFLCFASFCKSVSISMEIFLQENHSSHYRQVSVFSSLLVIEREEERTGDNQVRITSLSDLQVKNSQKYVKPKNEYHFLMLSLYSWRYFNLMKVTPPPPPVFFHGCRCQPLNECLRLSHKTWETSSVQSS